MHLAAEAEQVLITAAVDEDLPGNLEPIERFNVTVRDTDEGRISEIAAAGDTAEAASPASSGPEEAADDE